MAVSAHVALYRATLWSVHCPTITIWTVVQTVLTATFNSYGDRQISPPPHKINRPTPEPIDKKIGTIIDYIREGTSYTKFGRNPFTGGFWANGWNITKIIFIYLFIYTFFSQTRVYRSDLLMDFYARQLKKREITQGCAFWGYKTNLISNRSLFIPQNRQILARNGTFFRPKMLNNGGTQE